MLDVPSMEGLGLGDLAKPEGEAIVFIDFEPANCCSNEEAATNEGDQLPVSVGVDHFFASSDSSADPEQLGRLNLNCVTIFEL